MAEEKQQQTSGDSSLMKSSLQDEVDEKPDFGIIEGDTEGANEIKVANAVISGWELNLVLVW